MLILVWFELFNLKHSLYVLEHLGAKRKKNKNIYNEETVQMRRALGIGVIAIESLSEKEGYALRG